MLGSNVKKHKPGEKITVKIGGRAFETVIDGNGTQRFVENKLIVWLHIVYSIDLNKLSRAFSAGYFTQPEYLEFYTGLGYPVEGLAELSFFEDLIIENPA